MKSSDLVKMIREIVAEEVKRQLPGIVSEMYLRRIVSESIGGRRPVREDGGTYYGVDFDDTPEPLQNDDEGIYDKGPIGRKNESVKRNVLLDPKKNPYASMFEGVVPTNVREAHGTSRVPENSYGPGDPRRYAEIFKKSIKEESSRGPLKKSPEAIERELEMRRKWLDEQKVG